MKNGLGLSVFQNAVIPRKTEARGAAVALWRRLPIPAHESQTAISQTPLHRFRIEKREAA